MVILYADLDGTGGKPQVKESCKRIENLCSSFDLIDIWRIRNTDVKRFTWRQKNPIVQRRLDFWLIFSSIQEQAENVDIIPAIRTDHSASSMHINGIEETERGPSFWKFNASLLEDEDYIKLVTDKYIYWLEDSLRTGFPFPNYSDGGRLVAGASRRPINLLRSSGSLFAV